MVISAKANTPEEALALWKATKVKEKLLTFLVLKLDTFNVSSDLQL